MTRPTVLILRFSALGDVAMSSAVVTAAARRHPGVRFVVVTRPQFAPFFPADVEVEAIDLKHDYRGLLGPVSLASYLYDKYRPTAVADIHDVIRTKIIRVMMRLRGVRTAVIDKGRSEKKALTSGRHEALRHSTARYADTLRALGYDPGEPVEAPLGAPSTGSTPSIGIAPFAAHPGKTYPLDRMARAADIIRAKRPDMKIFWFSAPGAEAEKIKAVAAESDTIVATLGLKGGLKAEIDLMGSLDAMIAMDSGNMHMAALRGIPVVSVWGATHPDAGFAGASSPDSLRVQADMPCRPCSVYGNRPCHRSTDGSYPCLDAIEPAAIAEKILSLTASR